MPVPNLSSKKFAKLLKKHDCSLARQGSTSHAIFVRATSERKYAAPVQMGRSELDKNYIKLVLKQLGFSKEGIKQMFP